LRLGLLLGSGSHFPEVQGPILASIVNRSSFLIGDLLLGKLGETVVVHGDAPHNGPRYFVSHLVRNRAGFLRTKAPMLRMLARTLTPPLPAPALGE